MPSRYRHGHTTPMTSTRARAGGERFIVATLLAR